MLKDSPVKRWTSSAVKVAKFRRLKFFVIEILDDTFSCRQQPSSTIVITLSQNFGGKKMAPNLLVYLGRNSLFEQWQGEFHPSQNNQILFVFLLNHFTSKTTQTGPFWKKYVCAKLWALLMMLFLPCKRPRFSTLTSTLNKTHLLTRSSILGNLITCPSGHH